MNPIIRVVAFGASALSLVLCLALLRGELTLRSVREQLRIGAQVGVDEEGEISKLQNLYRRRSLPAEVAWQSARAMHRFSESVRDPARQIDLLCSELVAVEKALAGRPNNGRYLVAWANLRQALGAVQCSGSASRTNSDFRAALSRSIEVDGSNPLVLYSAALVYIWDGKDRPAALALLNRFLTLGTDVSAGQERVIANELRSVADVSAVIPGRFPQIVRWSELLQDRDIEDFGQIRAALVSLQLQALEKSRREWQRGAIPSEIYSQRLMALRLVISGDEVRRQVDSELGVYLEKRGDKLLAQFLSERSALSSLGVVRATIPMDSRPQKAALWNWGSTDEVAFDHYYRTVGFFLPGNRRPAYVVITGRGSVVSVEHSFIKLLGSNDNQIWTDISDGAQISTYQLGDTPMVAIDTRRLEKGYRFWKVNFASGAKDMRVINNLEQLLSVYG